ncbi:hypothetical protein WUBG_02658 [Wuchereria bancrofti]|uniref:Uncharacterized protein n=1 Tax=Wuchereria bancrofti TaxID=6293 RepID=J9EW68_WUCBA|nr:hypothetical protein WUBG_02658 [Wuchereria bancrofti]
MSLFHADKQLISKLLTCNFMREILLKNSGTQRPHRSASIHEEKAVMTFNHDQKDITFSYDNCCTVLKTRFMSQVPWSPPRGCKLRFISDIRNEEEMILEFENHEKLMEAFSILKDKYLERSQFVFSSEVHSGRGLHTTNVGSRMETSTDHETLSMLVESRRSRVKDR